MKVAFEHHADAMMPAGHPKLLVCAVQASFVSRINFFCAYAFAVFNLSCYVSRHGVLQAQKAEPRIPVLP